MLSPQLFGGQMFESQEEKEKWERGKRHGYYNFDMDSELVHNIIYRDGYREGMLLRLGGQNGLN